MNQNQYQSTLSLDKDRPGLQGYGIQQDNPYGLLEYYYDAGSGSMIWQHSTTPPAGDVGRGVIGDVDPRYPGYEVWSFSGIYNAPTNTQLTPADNSQSTADNRPYPAFRLWWDGDLLSESFNDGKIEKFDYSIGGDINNWDYSVKRVKRLLRTTDYHSSVLSDRRAPVFYGPTDKRIYTLAQNPLYRSNMASKGYLESHLTDFYLGDGMNTPPVPNIYLAP
ncbi:rhamnogalacturonan lyase family protein [Clostridium sp. Marseille-P2415]|uniref:rhamnogalacturonan lyase family protein n=1 Tax=Clostridium sp. Marseille-P2415 TaxID=1805471 RepID=UPI0013565596|nr:hypothetical protein [Clostridium sp. Marseille-P2415]